MPEIKAHYLITYILYTVDLTRVSLKQWQNILTPKQNYIS